MPARTAFQRIESCQLVRKCEGVLLLLQFRSFAKIFTDVSNTDSATHEGRTDREWV